MKITQLTLFGRYTFLALLTLFCFNAAAQTIQFEYDLKITADPAKRPVPMSKYLV